MTVVREVNDAADAVADAKAMIWAIFFIVQGMHQDDVQDAITACCNQALEHLIVSAKQLEGIAAGLRCKEAL